MGCSNRRHKTCHDKSCQRYYNNNWQSFVAETPLTLTVAGASVVDSGISIATEPQSYNILKTGIYHISGDIVATVATAGAGTFEVYLDGVALPCTIKTVSLPVGNTAIHTETDIAFDNCCCNIDKSITFVFTPSVSGTIATFCSNVTKLA